MYGWGKATDVVSALQAYIVIQTARQATQVALAKHALNWVYCRETSKSANQRGCEACWWQTNPAFDVPTGDAQVGNEKTLATISGHQGFEGFVDRRSL